jgi:hypothetical protein
VGRKWSWIIWRYLERPKGSRKKFVRIDVLRVRTWDLQNTKPRCRLLDLDVGWLPHVLARVGPKLYGIVQCSALRSGQGRNARYSTVTFPVSRSHYVPWLEIFLVSLFATVPVFRRLRKIARSDCCLLHVCPSVCLSSWDGFSLNLIFEDFSKLCRENSS